MAFGVVYGNNVRSERTSTCESLVGFHSLHSGPLILKGILMRLWIDVIEKVRSQWFLV